MRADPEARFVATCVMVAGDIAMGVAGGSAIFYGAVAVPRGYPFGSIDIVHALWLVAQLAPVGFLHERLRKAECGNALNEHREDEHEAPHRNTLPTPPAHEVRKEYLYCLAGPRRQV